jgi:enoyl-CoA hydratase/carnithine racemase
MIDAREALKIGLANQVVPNERLPDAALAIAQRIGKKSPLDLKLSRIAIDQGMHSSFEPTLQLEASHLLICAAAQNQEKFVNKKLAKMKVKQ